MTDVSEGVDTVEVVIAVGAMPSRDRVVDDTPPPESSKAVCSPMVDVGVTVGTTGAGTAGISEARAVPGIVTVTAGMVTVIVIGGGGRGAAGTAVATGTGATVANRPVSVVPVVSNKEAVLAGE